MTHMMIDTETLAVQPGAIIRSIGAVMFHPGKDGLGKEFYMNIDRASCEALKMIVDPSTQAFWDRPENANAAKIFGEDPQDIEHACRELSQFFVTNGGIYVWSHGANFDQPIVEEAYRRTGWGVPWKFWNSRCTRTMYHMGQVDIKTMPREGIHHNALDDAKNQARWVRQAVKNLGQG